jgi:hypothetical protein
MRAVFACLGLWFLTASAARGQFEILSVERRVEVTHPSYGTMSAEGGAQPVLLQVGEPHSPSMPYAANFFQFYSNSVGAVAQLLPRQGSANSTLAATFMLTEPLIAQIHCNHDGGGLVRFTGPTGAFLCNDHTSFYPSATLMPGEYHIDLIHSTESGPTLGGGVSVAQIPEPATWLAAASMLCLFIIGRYFSSSYTAKIA